MNFYIGIIIFIIYFLNSFILYLKYGTQSEIRTHTERILSPLPLPIGLLGYLFWWKELDSNQQCLPFGTDLQSAATPPSLPSFRVWC